MPWCDDCSRFFTPTSMGKGGECPSCGRKIADPPKAPWHFKLLMVITAVYLTWRLVQGVAWLAHKV